MKDLIKIAEARDPSVIYEDPDDDAYLQIENIRARNQPPHYTIQGTLMKVDLDPALDFQKTIRLEIEFIYDLMETTDRSKMAAWWGVRSGHRNGVYTISKWFPKIAVYDDTGWNLDPYRYLGEFYADFGNYRVAITVPNQMVVGATGCLYKTVRNSDNTKTLKFEAQNVHDFAWVASKRYQVLEYRWEDVVLRVLYLNSSEKDIGRYGLNALKYFSQLFGKYAYQNLTVAEVEVGGGMEYPGIVTIGGGEMREVVHEVAHQWWYGAVGNDEIDQPWLDEGFAVYSTEKYLINNGHDPLSVRQSANFEEVGIPVLTSSDNFTSQKSYFKVIYQKGSGILWMLEYLWGEELLIKVLRQYYRQYKFKNARVKDFIATVCAVVGQNYDWFFDQWLTTTKRLDFFIGSVTSQAARDMDSPRYVHQFEVKRAGEAIMPVRIEISLNINGRRAEIIKYMEAKSSSSTFTIRSNGTMESIIIDPKRSLLEENRLNNRWFNKPGEQRKAKYR